MGEALGVWVCDGVPMGEAVGCEVRALRVGDGCGELCSDEHDKRESVKAIVKRKTLGFTFKRLLIKLLLTDGILQNS
jgi:hypothetical protein